MATSSITKQFVIKDKEALDRLMEIIEEREQIDEITYVKKACEIVSDYESDHPETCYDEDDIRILTSFQDEALTDVYHVLLMTDHIYDIQFHDNAYIILEIYSSCDFRRYERDTEI